MSNNPLARQLHKKYNGMDFVLQMIPAEQYLDIMDRNKNEDGNIKQGAYCRDILNNMMVQPKLTNEVFNTMFTGNIKLLRKLVKDAETFVMGEDVVEDEEVKNADMAVFNSASIPDGYFGGQSQKVSYPIQKQEDVPMQNLENVTQQ